MIITFPFYILFSLHTELIQIVPASRSTEDSVRRTVYRNAYEPMVSYCCHKQNWTGRMSDTEFCIDVHMTMCPAFPSSLPPRELIFSTCLLPPDANPQLLGMVCRKPYFDHSGLQTKNGWIPNLFKDVIFSLLESAIIPTQPSTVPSESCFRHGIIDGHAFKVGQIDTFLEVIASTVYTSCQYNP
jgi:hypothetical protein